MSRRINNKVNLRQDQNKSDATKGIIFLGVYFVIFLGLGWYYSQPQRSVSRVHIGRVCRGSDSLESI